MRRRHRHIHRRRYGGYSGEPPVQKNVIGIVILVIVLIVCGKWVLTYFGVGNTIQRHGSTLTMANLGNVQVSIEGGEFKRAENEQKLYPGDRLTTGVGAHAVLTFFDKTAFRLNELSDVTIEETFSGENTSEISLYIQEGSVWVSSSEKEVFTGSIVRNVRTPHMELTLPSSTESVITQKSLVVFAADGIGITLNPEESVIPVVVGEGQKFVLPQSYTKSDDLYAYRSPLDPSALQSSFVQESRELHSGVLPPLPVLEGPTPVDPLEEDEALVVLGPQNDTLIKGSTVDVHGKVGKKITHVRVNGYSAPLESTAGTFSLELALPDEDEVEIVITGMDANGSVVSEIRRQVLRDREPPSPPTITSPALTGQTYRTGRERFIIEGTVPADTISVIVNDYRLQLYNPGSTTWTYLASTTIDNLHPGENTYKVVAINDGGYRSEPAVLTILLEEGEEGVLKEEGGEEDESGELEGGGTLLPRELPNNRPLRPGSLKVIAPTAGLHHTATGSSFLIEGTTTSLTHSLWVNDYRLRLYAPRKTTWNYIADTNLRTLHPGENEYNIVTRDSRNRILDTMTYTVEYRP